MEEEMWLTLSDKERPGAPSVFTPDQIMKIISLACSNPGDFGYEVGHWSLSLLVTEIKKQGITERISEKSVSHFFKVPSVELGKKWKNGILKNVEIRSDFLHALSHRIRFAYTPKHSS